MAYIKKKSERKFKITVCNGYKVNGQKRMKAQTITVPSSVPKRGIQQYVMAEAERIEKKFKYGVEESDQTHFEQYAENWLKRQQPFFKTTTYAGYKRNLGIVYPLIGGIPLAKLLPMTLEEMCGIAQAPRDVVETASKQRCRNTSKRFLRYWRMPRKMTLFRLIRRTAFGKSILKRRCSIFRRSMK